MINAVGLEAAKYAVLAFVAFDRPPIPYLNHKEITCQD